MNRYEYRITGLPREPFTALFSLDDEQLAHRGVTRQIANKAFSYPCRISLQDASVGEELLLLSYEHLSAASPYRASGPIYIRRHAGASFAATNMIPEQQQRRLLSVRAYDAAHFIVDAEVVAGTELEALIQRFFSNSHVCYLHVHNARPGCYACRIERV